MATAGIDLDLLKAMITPITEDSAADTFDCDFSMVDEGSVNSFLLSLLPTQDHLSDAIEINDAEVLSRSGSLLQRLSVDIPGTSQTLDMYLADENGSDDETHTPLLMQSFSSSTLSSSSSSESEGIAGLTTPTNDHNSKTREGSDAQVKAQIQPQTPFISNHTVLFTPSRSSRSLSSRGHKNILPEPLSQIRLKDGLTGALHGSNSEAPALNPFAPSFKPKLWWIGSKSSAQSIYSEESGSPRAKSFFGAGEQMMAEIDATEGVNYELDRKGSVLRRRMGY